MESSCTDSNSVRRNGILEVSTHLQTDLQIRARFQLNESIDFLIASTEKIFSRLAICDSAQNGRVIYQRVVPVKCLRPGYRHLPLRTPSNQPMDSATLFIRTKFEQVKLYIFLVFYWRIKEEHIYLHDEDSTMHSNVEHPLSYLNDTVRNSVVEFNQSDRYCGF